MEFVVRNCVLPFTRTVFPLYRMSYMWYTFFGAMVAILVACIWTLIFGGNDPADIDSSLLTPMIRNRFRKKVSVFDHSGKFIN